MCIFSGLPRCGGFLLELVAKWSRVCYPIESRIVLVADLKKVLLGCCHRNSGLLS